MKTRSRGRRKETQTESKLTSRDRDCLECGITLIIVFLKSVYCFHERYACGVGKKSILWYVPYMKTWTQPPSRAKKEPTSHFP